MSYSQENMEVGKREEKNSVLLGGSAHDQKHLESEITQLRFMLEQNENESRRREQADDGGRREDLQRWAEMLSSTIIASTEPR